MKKSKVDEIDLEILAELDHNARQTNTTIGRNLNLNKNTVNYHISELERSGIIKGYTAVTDFFRLGYVSYRVYLKLQYVNKKREEEIMNYLQNSPNTWYCSFVKGKFDICSSFFSKTPQQFINCWNDFKKLYGFNIKKAVIAPHYGDVFAKLPFTKRIHKKKGNSFTGLNGPLNIDKNDESIIKVLVSNGRASLSSIAKEVGLTPGGVKYRIDQLVEKGIIKSFNPWIDTEKFGYTQYKVDFNLNFQGNDPKNMEQFLLKRTNLSSIIKTIGFADLEAKFYFNSVKELYGELYEIRDEFPEQIQDFDFYAFPAATKKLFSPF